MCLLENLNLCNYPVFLGFPGGTVVKNVCQFRRCKRQGFDPWVGKIPWSRKWQPTPVFLRGKFHGERSLAGYSPWGHEESDMSMHAQAKSSVMENLFTHFILTEYELAKKISDFL